MIRKYTQALKKFLKNRKAETLIILGSGLGGLTNEMSDKDEISYHGLGFPEINVTGHAGRLVYGTLGEKKVLCMEGRYHLYEGHAPEVVKEIICAFAAVGVKKIIVTNASGSLKRKIKAGNLVVITDHINLSGCNPLIGQNDDKTGPRFPSLNDVYDKEARNNLKTTAARHHIKLKEGVYMMVLGPNFETPAEVRAFGRLGADVVGMSTVPEVIAAAYAGIKVLGVSVVTNMAAGLQKHMPSHEETLATAQKASSELVRLLESYLREN